MSGKPNKPRKRHGYHTSWGLAETASGALALDGLLDSPQPGWMPNIEAVFSRDPALRSDALYNITQSIPVYGKDPNMAAARSKVLIGAGGYVVSKVLGKLIPGLRRPIVRTKAFSLRFF